MWAGRGEHDWQLFAALIAKIHNVNCGKRADMIDPDDVNPHARARRHAAPPARGSSVGVDVLTAMLVGRR